MKVPFRISEFNFVELTKEETEILKPFQEKLKDLEKQKRDLDLEIATLKEKLESEINRLVMSKPISVLKPVD